MLGMPAVEAKEMIPERDHTHSFTQHYYTGHGVLSYDSHTYVYYQYGNTQYTSLCTYSIENADFYAQCPSCGALRSTSTCNHHYRDDILWNELKDYFGGNITREQLYDHLRNRIGLYLNEQF